MELTELAADGEIDTQQIMALEFDRLTEDEGGPDESHRTAFMVAGHVGYNLIAPLHGIPVEDNEFEVALDTANGAAETMANSYNELNDKQARSYDSETLLAVYRHRMNAARAASVELRKTERAAQSSLVRCILGNPFRPVTADPSWLTSTVTALAKQMYESRDFSAMPILADALQDAGCDNPDILDHCRGPGPHVRGCFVVDLILQKA